MNVAARKLRQKEELRALILRAARRIVTGEGFGALTMRRLASEIEYAPGTIYLYFANRDEIAMELCREGFRKLLSYLEPTGAIADPLTRLRAGLQAYARYAMEQQEMYRMTFMEAPKFAYAGREQASSDGPADPGMQAFGFLVQPFEQLRAEGRLATKLASQQLAEIFWTATHGIVSLKIAYAILPATPAEELVDASLDCLIRGILTAPGTKSPAKSPTGSARAARRSRR